MANNHENLTALFADIADAIREKSGTTDPIVADAFPEAISMIETGGGGDTSVEDGIIDRTITEITKSRITTVGSCAFNGCTSLTTISFPMATSIGDGAFNGCTSLTTISFPMATSIGNSAFQYCSSLTTASFPEATSIGNSAFNGCSSLTTAYFMGSSLCSLLNSNAFSRTGITSSTGTIYVPASLLTLYQSATNWAYFSTQFVAGD